MVKKPEVLTVKELIRRLQSIQDKDQEVHIAYEELNPGMRGPAPSLPITKLYTGFDWDHGKIFLAPQEKMSVAGEAFREQQKIAHESASKLGWVYYIANGDLPDDKKMYEIKLILRKD